MSQLIVSGIFGGGFVALILAVIFIFSKKFIFEYITNSVTHEFDKRLESFRSELQEKHQSQQHLHELLMQTVLQENKELKIHKIKASDQLWKSLLSKKKFNIAVKFLATLNYEEIKKRSEEPKMQRFLLSFPNCRLEDLLKETESNREQPAELARPWVSHKAWSLYLAYNMIVFYAILQFESAKLGGWLDGVLNENKLLEVIQIALPEADIKEIHPQLLDQLSDLLELSLLIELKQSIVLNEDEAAIERAKKIFEIATDLKNKIKLKALNKE